MVALINNITGETLIPSRTKEEMRQAERELPRGCSKIPDKLFANAVEAWLGLVVYTSTKPEIGEAIVLEWLEKVIVAVVPFAAQAFKDQDQEHFSNHPLPRPCTRCVATSSSFRRGWLKYVSSQETWKGE